LNAVSLYLLTYCINQGHKPSKRSSTPKVVSINQTS
jgi:hypothetical protein